MSFASLPDATSFFIRANCCVNSFFDSNTPRETTFTFASVMASDSGATFSISIYFIGSLLLSTRLLAFSMVWIPFKNQVDGVHQLGVSPSNLKVLDDLQHKRSVIQYALQKGLTLQRTIGKSHHCRIAVVFVVFATSRWGCLNRGVWANGLINLLFFHRNKILCS